MSMNAAADGKLFGAIEKMPFSKVLSVLNFLEKV